MALFRKPTPIETRAQPGFTWDQYVRLFTSGAGASVTQSSVQSLDVALGSSIVWRCAMKNAATLSSFPVHTKLDKRTETDPAIVRDPAGDGSLQAVWTFAVFVSMYLRGGAYGLVGPDDMAARLAPRFVPLIHPDRVDWSESNGWTLDGDPTDLYPLGPLWHCPMYVLPGSPKGLNPLQYARRSLFPGMAAQEFGANFFKDGAHPSALLSMGGATPDPTEAKALKDRIMGISGGTRREPLLLPGDVKWQSMQVNPDDSQFIEAMRLSDEQVCRYMGTPPEEVGVAPSSGSITYANREQRKQDYLQELLMPMQRLEGAWSSLIPGGRRVKLSPGGLLQADLAARYQSYKTSADVYAATGEWIVTPDEWRDLEEREPVAGYEPKPVPGKVQTNSAPPELLEVRTAMPERSDTHIHLPDNLAVEMRTDELTATVQRMVEAQMTAQDIATAVASAVASAIEAMPAPVINVAAPNVSVDAPVVTVEAPAVTVPVTVQPATVTVMEAEAPSTKKVTLTKTPTGYAATMTET